MFEFETVQSPMNRHRTVVYWLKISIVESNPTIEDY